MDVESKTPVMLRAEDASSLSYGEQQNIMGPCKRCTKILAQQKLNVVALFEGFQPSNARVEILYVQLSCECARAFNQPVATHHGAGCSGLVIPLVASLIPVTVPKSRVQILGFGIVANLVLSENWI